jgi:hypothetical protein
VPELAELEQDRCRALAASDLDALAALTHPRLRYTHSSGFTDTRESYLERCASGYYRYESIDLEVESSTVVGDVAVFEERMRARVVVAGEPRQLDTRAQVVWVRDDGVWQHLAYHATSA